MFSAMQPQKFCFAHSRLISIHYLIGHATCLWLPHYNHAMDKTEAVQRKGIQRGWMGAKVYKAQLPSPVQHREEAPVCRSYFYRITFGLVDVSATDYFLLKSANGDRIVTRGNPFKLSVNYTVAPTCEKILANVSLKFEIVYHQVLRSFLR